MFKKRKAVYEHIVLILRRITTILFYICTTYDFDVVDLKLLSISSVVKHALKYIQPAAFLGAGILYIKTMKV
jgi:hypothetical protein